MVRVHGGPGGATVTWEAVVVGSQLLVREVLAGGTGSLKPGRGQVDMRPDLAVRLALFLAVRFFWTCCCFLLGLSLPTWKVGRSPGLPDGLGAQGERRAPDETDFREEIFLRPKTYILYTRDSKCRGPERGCPGSVVQHKPATLGVQGLRACFYICHHFCFLLLPTQHFDKDPQRWGVLIDPGGLGSSVENTPAVHPPPTGRPEDLRAGRRGSGKHKTPGDALSPHVECLLPGCFEKRGARLLGGCAWPRLEQSENRGSWRPELAQGP